MYRLQKDGSIFLNIFFPTVLWAARRFCLGSLRQFQSDSSWIDWARRSKIESFRSLTFGDASQLGYLSFPHLYFIRRTSEISCCPSLLFFSLFLFLLHYFVVSYSSGCLKYFLISLIQFSCEGCGHLMPFYASLLILSYYARSMFFSQLPLPSKSFYHFWDQLVFLVWTLEWNCKTKKTWQILHN